MWGDLLSESQLDGVCPHRPFQGGQSLWNAILDAQIIQFLNYEGEGLLSIPVLLPGNADGHRVLPTVTTLQFVIT